MGIPIMICLYWIAVLYVINGPSSKDDTCVMRMMGSIASVPWRCHSRHATFKSVVQVTSLAHTASEKRVVGVRLDGIWRHHAPRGHSAWGGHQGLWHGRCGLRLHVCEAHGGWCRHLVHGYPGRGSSKWIAGGRRGGLGLLGKNTAKWVQVIGCKKTARHHERQTNQWLQQVSYRQNYWLNIS